MQGDTTTPPFGAEAFDPVTQHPLRVQNEKTAAAELARAHRHRAGRQLTEPEIDLGLGSEGDRSGVTTGAACGLVDYYDAVV